ncbi:hypothetical protein Lac2_01840 [Claveliimonas bilis]|uniref:L,D-transpeptidase family protein n=1 Tax=Claveliimonas bilis TaxID=3028070 RepID=UPI00292CD53F|nr:L,D-transpeptidase family protein [Claveliimonas bilis]BDZ82050.1 hypothetical protein Lac2_01840 [Claveliimonas bilis]
MKRLKGVTAIVLSAFLIFGSAGSALASEGTVTSAPVTSDTADNSLEDQTENGGVTGETGLEETEPETGDEQKETDYTTDQRETEKAESDETKDSSAGMTNSGDTVTEDPTAGEETGTDGTGEETEEGNEQDKPEEEQIPKLSYRVHVQSSGWNNWTENSGIIGTTGKGKRLEAIQLKVKMPEQEATETPVEGTDPGTTGLDAAEVATEEPEQPAGIEYRVHAQSYGWMDWVKDGAQAGTTGQGKRLEAIQIRLTGSLADQYDIYYRAHVESYGWLNWTANGEKSGSLGYGKRMEALEIRLVKKGEAAPTGEGDSYKYPDLSYQAHVQSVGWQAEKFNGQTAGVTGQAKRMEAIKIKLPDKEYEGGIEYQTHVQSIGWQGWKRDGQIAGTTGQKKRLEAIQIRLTGEMANQYDVYYRAHVQSFGWLGWAKNGEEAGTLGYGKRMEALEIRLIKKGEDAPAQTAESFKYPLVSYQAHSQSVGWQEIKADNDIAGVTGKGKRMEAIKIQLPNIGYEGSIEYRTYVQSIGWQGWKKDGQIAGTTNQAKRIEAIEIKLSGEVAEHYDVYYSIHMSKIGWTNYAVNGETAGSTDLSKRIEAIKIQLVEKGGKAPNTSGTKFIEGYKASDMYYSGTIQGKGNSGNVQMGGTLGTTGQSKRLENITVTLNRRTEAMPSGTIKYAVHLSKTGWTGWSEAGKVSGCTDGSKGIEAVKFSLSGDLSKYYDIYYRTYVQKYGWLGWAKNGQAAGTSKIGYRVEALQIRLVSKDASAPGANRNYYTEQRIVSGPDAGMYARANLYSSSTPYIIMVDRGNRKVGVYQGWRGAWKNVKYWSCTVGAPSTPTVSGVFKVGSRGYYFNSGNVRCFWWTQFYGDYLFHSTTYYHNGAVADSRLGLALSHGCVRLNINNAKWIYDTVPTGSTVVVYN